MRTRSNKRRICRLFHGRFHGPIQWRSAEERAWLDLVPLGREFGSRDYHRFQQLDSFAYDLFGDMRLAQQWLSQPHSAIGGRVPNDCTGNDSDLQKVLDLMAYLKRNADHTGVFI